MFTVYHSNQLDILEALIAALIEREPLTNPFEQEVILVQSPGMAQWLQIRLAERFSVAANIAFPLPATFIWNMFTEVLPGIPKESAFSKSAMTWKLMALLPSFLSRPAFSALHHYLIDDSDRRKIYQLAARIADLFDQYLVYRPEWLTAWQQGEMIENLEPAQQWQAPLWQALVEYTAELQQPEWHRANLYRRFISALQEAKKTPVGLPSRVFICGISALPPVYLQALQALGEHIDIHLMFTNPCRYYWGDIQDYRFLARLQNKKRRHFRQQLETSLFRTPENAAALFDEQGEQQISNPLLASWGKLGRDNLYLLAQLDQVQEVDAFVDPGSETLLQRIQRDILVLEDNAQLGLTAELLESSQHKQVLCPDDFSLSFHLCHSPQREVEVLHDRLLSLLDNDPELTLRDIIVMVADIDSYAPYIQAVFGNSPQRRYLPFAVSDRRASETHPVLQAFLSLLDLPHSRFTIESILSLLEVPSIAARFSIDEHGLRLLTRWISESGVRWGLDDETQSLLELPVTGQHTWLFGLTRMLLGYAMESQTGEWQGVLPYDESRGLVAEIVGYLAELLMQLTHWRQVLGENRTLEEWTPLCHSLLEAFFVRDIETEAAFLLIEQQWQKIIGEGQGAKYSETVPVTILRDELASRLDTERISQRFLAGPINFCTLMPMRSVPFKVVCLLGMNDGVYPRTLPHLGFDLMARQSKRGDRSRREDDRYLFLEALLSAQQQLYISYIGRSIQDNSERYPSVLISELLEYIGQSHCLVGEETLDADTTTENVIRHLQIHHPREPFNPDNFMAGDRWQSYADEWLSAARGEGEAFSDFSQRLSLRDISLVSLDELCRFYRHPVRSFFQQRLGVYFTREEQELLDEEPFVLDGLSRYKLNTQLLNILIEGGDPERQYARYRAAGDLPYGAFGELFWQQQYQEMEALAENILEQKQESHSLELNLLFDKHTGPDALRVTPPAGISADAISRLTLCGWLNSVQADGLLRWRPAELSIIDGLQLWLEHLAYCASGGIGESRMFGKNNKNWRFRQVPQDEAIHYLSELLTDYCEGLCQPLMLFPKTGWAWLESCYNAQDHSVMMAEEVQEKARVKLRLAWQGNQIVNGEGNDLYIHRALPELDEPGIERIMVQTMKTFLPLILYREEK